MANNYDKIIELANANNMGLSNTIKRDFGIPLDFTSVQASYDTAVEYAATNTLAYVGQPISVGAKLYIITDVANGTHTVGEGEDAKTYDNYLAEVGSATEGDGNTIELDGKVLKLAGLKGLDNSKTYVPSLVNGKLVWAEPDTSTAEGQAQEINALKTRTAELEATVNGVEAAEGVEAKEGLVDKVAANATAITDEAAAREDADNAINAKIGEVAEGKTVVELIADAEKAAKDAIPTNNNQLENGAGYQTADDVATAIAGKADKATTLAGYGISDAYTQDQVNELIAGITHFTTKIVASVDEVTENAVLYLIKDESVTGGDKYNEYIYIADLGAVQIGDTTTDLSDYVTNEALNTAIKDFITASALEPYAKTADVNAALDLKANAADVVANTVFEQFKTDNTTAIATAKQEAIDAADQAVQGAGYAVATEVAETYAEKATTLAGYGITDAYTKSETVAKTDVYTKTEVDRLLDEVSGGSSETAASVKRSLDGYIQNMDTEVYGSDVVASWTAEDGSYVPTYAETTSRIDTALSNAAAAQTQADKGVADAAKAQGVADTAKSQSDTNKTDIAALTTQITNRNQTVDEEIANLKAKDTTIDGEIAGLKTTTSNHSTTIGEHTAKISALESKDTELAGLIAGVDGKFADYSTTTQMNKAIDDKIAAIPAVDLTDYAKSADVEATYAKIGDAYTKSEADLAFMTEAEVDARINALIVGADPEGGKAITDIQNLVKYVDENAGEIASLITATDANTAKLAGIDTTVTEYVANQIASIVTPKASAEVTVAEDGTLGIGEVNVNKLMQTEGDELIIHGGNA